MTDLQILQTFLATLRPYLVKGSIDEAKSKCLIENLDNIISFFSSPIFEMRFAELHRVTINKYLFYGKNQRINEIKFVGYPPAERVKKNGRANYIGQSVFYATTNPITAINEIKPQKGDLITTSIWKQKENGEFLKTIPIFKTTTSNGSVHNELSL